MKYTISRWYGVARRRAKKEKKQDKIRAARERVKDKQNA